MSRCLSTIEMQVQFGLLHARFMSVGKSFANILGVFQKLASFGLICSPMESSTQISRSRSWAPGGTHVT